MHVEVVPAHSLCPEHVTAWSRLQQADPALDSPFLSPEFTQAVAAVRDDVEVGILQDDGRLVGFLPFQRTKANVGIPVGTPANDCQALIVSKDVAWDAKQLVRGCGLRAWKFDHLLASQDGFRPYHVVVADAPFIDLNDGFDAWQTERRKSGTDTIVNALRKTRKVQREIGGLRFEPACKDLGVMDTLIGWKREQCRRTKVGDIFSLTWVEPLLAKLLSTENAGFRGILSAVYVGDRLIAAHLGMQAGSVLHSWFQSYDMGLQRYSPGLILWTQIAQACEEIGIRRIDLGKGDALWKRSFGSGTFAVAEGAVDFRPVTRLVTRRWLRMRDRVRRSRLRGLGHRVDRLLGQTRSLLGRRSPFS